MGNWLRLKAKKSYPQEFEELQKELSEAETRKILMERGERRVSRSFLIYSIPLYIGSGTICFLFFPTSLQHRLAILALMISTPILLWAWWKMMKWFYVSRIVYTEERLTEIRGKKKALIEQIKSNESYRTAKEILDRFGDEDVEENDISVRRRKRITGPHSNDSFLSAKNTSMTSHLDTAQSGNYHLSIHDTSNHGDDVTNNSNHLVENSTGETMKLVRSLIQPDRGLMVRLLEWFLSDGPNNRYALICIKCHMHNGMAFREEVNNLTYYCAFCGCYNGPSTVTSGGDHNDISKSETKTTEQRSYGREYEEVKWND